MTSKRSRERHLAKLARRRQQERYAVKRRRNVTLGVIGALVGIAVVVAGIVMLTGGGDTSATPTPTPSASKSPGGSKGPQQVGTVTAQDPPPAQVACGGTRPDSASVPKPQFDRAPTPKEVLDKGATYTAVMQTSCGTIEITLATDTAPQTTASFIFLARQGYFDGTFFYRVVDSIDVIQGGDPLGTGNGGPGYSIPDELTGKETYTLGTVAMAKSTAPDSGGSQFFIITGPQGTNLDLTPSYTIFAQVVKGLGAAQKINALVAPGADDSPPIEVAYIVKVTIKETKAPASPTPTSTPSDGISASIPTPTP